MKRGVITLTKEEINEVFKRAEVDRFSSDTLQNKMGAAFDSALDIVQIELSEDELEFILDEIIIPLPEVDNDHTITLRQKIQELLQDFRTSEVNNS